MESFILIIIVAIFLLSLLLLGTVVILIIYSGLLYQITIGTGKPPIKGVTIAYKFNRGPYKEAGAIFSEVSGIAPDNLCLGLYYDDPEKVTPDKLRYAVAAVVSSDDKDKRILKALEKKNYKLFPLPEVSYAVITKFPYRTQISILVAIWRVYPQLSSYIKEKKLCAYPMVEVYSKEWIHFMAPLAKQDQFIVPEAQPEEEASDRDESIADESLNVSEVSMEGHTSQSSDEPAGKESSPSETSYSKRGGSTSEPEKLQKGVAPSDPGAASAINEEFVVLHPDNKKQK